MSKQTMGEFLALLRKANGFTQQDVADKLNISNRTLSSWETDRTTPDILLLPAIADLYGVTVDELLRCERNMTPNNDKQISEEALMSKRKHRLGKFSATSLLLSCLGCFGAVMIALSFIFWLYAGSPTWLFILLIVLSACDITICVVILFYLYYNSKVAEGLVLKEDYTEEKKPYALAFKRLSAKFFLFCAIPLIAFAVAMGIAMIIINPYNYEILGVTVNVVGAYAATICTSGGLGIAFLVAYFVYTNANFKSLANETQAANHKYNAKLLGKTVGFGTIPFVAYFILMIILASCLNNYNTIYHTGNFEEFRTYMHTLTVDEQSAKVCGIEPGEYQLNVPENIGSESRYDLGNGFTGVFRNYSDYGSFLNVIFILSEYEGGYSYYDLGEYKIIKDSCIVVNMRNKIEDITLNCDKAINEVHYKTNILGIEITDSYWLLTPTYDNFYTYEHSTICELSVFAAWLLGSVTLLTVVSCSVIYFVKRKKQSYEL